MDWFGFSDGVGGGGVFGSIMIISDFTCARHLMVMNNILSSVYFCLMTLLDIQIFQSTDLIHGEYLPTHHPLNIRLADQNEPATGMNRSKQEGDTGTENDVDEIAFLGAVRSETDPSCGRAEEDSPTSGPEGQSLSGV